MPSTNPFWYFIEQAAAHGALSGYNCGSLGEPCFPPQNKPYFRWGVNITRGQVAKAVVLGKGWNTPPPTTQQTFEDVPVTNVYWYFVEQAFAHGVLSGYNCGGTGEPCVPPGNRHYFRPGNQVTRAQLSKMIVLGVTQP